eukprot:s2166_g6.t1
MHAACICNLEGSKQYACRRLPATESADAAKQCGQRDASRPRILRINAHPCRAFHCPLDGQCCERHQPLREGSREPSGIRNFQEMALGFTSDIAKNNLGESFYRPWVPFITTIFLFIFVSNWSGALIPWKLFEIPAGQLAAPTNNINTTVALSLLTSLAYFGGGLAKKGLGYFARYVKPTPILLPINILEDFTKPLSLSFRLFGNVVADELTVGVLCFLVPFVIPLPIMGLGLFAGSIQALIFSTLAAAYIHEACGFNGQRPQLNHLVSE